MSIAGDIYAVTTTTVRRVRHFRNLRRGRCVVAALRDAEARNHAKTLAFVVMPDHLHWMFRLGHGAPLSSVVARAKREAAARLNQLDGAPGRGIWQRGYYEHQIRADEDQYLQAQYIIENPVRAGLVATSEDYPLWDWIWC